jgi:hypothetical protein
MKPKQHTAPDRHCSAIVPPEEGGRIARFLRGTVCHKPATHTTLFGLRCDACAEKVRQDLASPDCLLNILAKRDGCSADEIARRVRPLQ